MAWAAALVLIPSPLIGFHQFPFLGHLLAFGADKQRLESEPEAGSLLLNIRDRQPPLNAKPEVVVNFFEWWNDNTISVKGTRFAKHPKGLWGVWAQDGLTLQFATLARTVSTRGNMFLRGAKSFEPR